MTTAPLFVPFLLILAGALLASLGRLSAGRRTSSIAWGWLLAGLPLAAFIWLLSWLPLLADGSALTWQTSWLPALSLSVGFYFDSLSALFALLVTGIGALVLIYAGYYFKGDADAWRFRAYILLFMASMLGLVMAGDVLSLFVFWEGTSIVSFLLVAYKTKSEEARRGAFKALLITGGGGVALLAGLLFVSAVAGSTAFPDILAAGDTLRASDLYLVMLGLVAFGAMTKSAQVPAHIWLPRAMSAPTPASAYLHSATMVKAGIYLLARLNPALGGTEGWFWLLSIVGAVTMVTGAYLGLKQTDLKALLAYATVTQLGVLVLLIGQDTDLAFKALVVGVLAHALYKSALFLVVGIVDHEAGTRDLARLGGLRRSMPISFGLAAVAALSMAGLPPLFGFLAKETLLGTLVHPSLPAALGWLFPALTVVAGGLLLAQASVLVWETFLGEPRDAGIQAHEAPRGMLLAPLVPTILSLAVGILPEPEPLARFLANAAGAAYGDKVKVSLALWTGLNVPLGLSVVAVAFGSVIFWQRDRVRAWQRDHFSTFSFDAVHAGTLALLDRLADLATRLQLGRLRVYLAVILSSTLLLVLAFAWPGLRQAIPDSLRALTWPGADWLGELAVLRVVALVMVSGSAIATIALHRDFFAILALGVSGLSMATLFVLEPAPDVALVQIVVDILSVVILVLALTRLPRERRHRARALTFLQSRPSLVRDGIIATVAGGIVSAMTLVALTSRPRASVITPYFEANAKPLAGAKDIVGAIVVDFRALDTLVEIAVFSLAGLAIYTLLRYAAFRFPPVAPTTADAPPVAVPALAALGISGRLASPLIRVLANIALPLSLVIAAVHMMYGHDQPGDGFTAGVIVSLAVGFWYVVFGYEEVRSRLTWLRPRPFIAAGLLLAVFNGVVSSLFSGAFLGNTDYGSLIGLPLPAGFYFSSSFLFEVAIYLSVLGSAAAILNTLGHPEERVHSE